MLEPGASTMIDISTLTERDKGRRVLYHPRDFFHAENGTITSWNEQWVFVQYSKDGSRATDPRDLDFVGDP